MEKMRMGKSASIKKILLKKQEKEKRKTNVNLKIKVESTKKEIKFQ